jgi:protein-disulfide isomerase
MSDNTTLLVPVRDDDHVHGPASASLTLVEYGDYECPDCGRLFEIIQGLPKTLGERLRIVYRHYPLSGIHPYAQEASEAAQAAGAQNRFWEMHDLLFRSQNALQRKHLLTYAESLALDMDRFSAELKKHVHRERVREDFRRGVANGVYGTPGLFLNEVRHAGAWDRDTLLQKLSPTTPA